MTRRMADCQLTLDLFQERNPKRDPEEWVAWLVNQHGVDTNGVAMARRIFAELPWREATERCKVVPILSGSRRIDGFTVADIDLFGVFDLALDYHVCWDRKWAAKQGVPKERIASIAKWDYGKKVPVFMEECRYD